MGREMIFAVCEYDAKYEHICDTQGCNGYADHRFRVYLRPDSRENSLAWNAHFCDKCYEPFMEAMKNSPERYWMIKMEFKEFAYERIIDFRRVEK